MVLLTPYLRRLLRLLHELATDEVSELKDFAAILRSICGTLFAEGALDPAYSTPRNIVKPSRNCWTAWNGPPNRCTRWRPLFSPRAAAAD